MKQTCILILGMHRSGTSALTGVLSLLDVYLGSDILKPDASNEKGYFENNHLYKINKNLLSQINSSWQDLFFDTEKIKEIKDTEELKKTLRKEFGYSNIFAIKDPRIAYIFPIYQKVLNELDIDVKVIIPYRNPIEVATSLNKRNAFSLEKGMLLWAYHLLLSEKFSRQFHRVFIDFDDLISDSENSIRLISKKLEIDIYAKYIKNKKAIDSFLEPDLKHHNISIDNISSNAPKIIRDILILKKDFNNQGMTSHFDALYDELFSNQKLFYNQDIIDTVTELNKLKQTFTRKEQDLHHSNRKLSYLELSLSNKEQELKGIIQKQNNALHSLSKKELQLIQSNQSLDSTQQSLSKKELQLTQSNQSLDNMQQSLNHQKQEFKLMTQKLDSAQQSLSKKEQDLKQSNQSLDNTQQTLSSKEHKLSLIIPKLNSTEQNLSVKNKELNQINQQNESLRDELVSIYSGKEGNIFKPFRRILRLKYFKRNRIIKESGFFDVKFYIFTYPDVRKSGIDPIIHYIKYGAKEGRKPNKEFDTVWYLDEYADVYNSKMNPLVHYIKYGVKEGRQINKKIHLHNANVENKHTATVKKKKQDVLLNANSTIDIILPVYNALEDVKKCINSLYKEKTYNFNLIVIDDCSNKPTENYLKQEAQQRDFKLLRNRENKRFTKSVNKGFEQAKGDYVILLNSDTIVTRRWIEKLLLCFESDSNIGIAGPLSNAASWQSVPVRNDKKSGDWMINTIPHGYSIEAMGNLVETISLRLYPKVPSVNGFCYAIKREVLDSIGGLDEENFPTGYGEEDDFSIRAQQAGFNIAVADDTYIYHSKSKSYTHEIRKTLTKGGRESLDRKHGIARVKKLINDWKIEPELPRIAKHIESYIQISTKNKKVVYTAIFGNYDAIHEPEYINEDWDYICFTDNKDFKSNVFKIKYVSPVFDNITKNSRMVKILSHLFLINYKYSLWIDGNVKLRGRNIDELVVNNKENDYISLHRHLKRVCIYDEAKACINAQKDKKSHIVDLVDSYKKEGMPEKIGLVETAEILRQQFNPLTINLNDAWWEEINTFTIRDQLSFNYICWKYGFTYKILEGHQWLDPFFNIYKHGIKKNVEQHSVAIVILWNNNEVFVEKNILHIIQKTTYTNYKIILVLPYDNNKHIRSVVEQYKQLSYIEMASNLTCVEKRNQAANKIQEKYICFLNENIELIENNWLTLLINEMHFNKNVVVAGPAILDAGYAMKSMSINIKQNQNNFIEAVVSTRVNQTENVFAIDDSCMLLDREVFSLLGMFSNKYSSKVATLDYCFKVLEHKYRCRFVLNSQMIDHSQIMTLEQQRVDSHQLQKPWAGKAIFGENINKQNRKKKIAYLPERVNSGAIAGSGYIRTVIPISKFLPEDNIDFEEHASLASIDFSKIDILLVQRTALLLNEIHRLVDQCKKHQTKLIYEIDDDLITHFKNNKDNLKEDSVKLMLKVADHIIVSTFNLKERYSQFNLNITVIENSLDLSLWKVNRQPLDSQIKCLYMGTKTHQGDLSLIEKDIIKLKSKYDQFNIDIIGIADNDYVSKIGNVINIPKKVDNYKKFVTWLNSNNQWHIGLAPLEENFFNKTKSHIKFLDYSAMGLATVCSNVDSYNKTIEHGIDGILVDNREGEWYKALEKLILEQHKINTLRDNAYKKLTNQYDIIKYKKKWINIFIEVLKN